LAKSAKRRSAEPAVSLPATRRYERLVRPFFHSEGFVTCDDPINGNAPCTIGPCHLLIGREASVGDLDKQADVFRPRMLFRVIVLFPSHHALIGLRLTIGRKPDRLVGQNMPARGDDPRQCFGDQKIGDGVRRVLSYLGHQDSVDELELVALRENTGVDQALILIDPHTKGRVATPARSDGRLCGLRDHLPPPPRLATQSATSLRAITAIGRPSFADSTLNC
jgi:hypothetical protein